MNINTMLLDALHQIKGCVSLQEAKSVAQDAFNALANEGEEEVQYGVAYAAHVNISRDYDGAVDSAKKHCLHRPGKNYCVVAVQNSFVGKVNVEELI